MPPQRETTTDSLADIIHIIHLGNRSGTLTVERGEKTNIEEGSITFSNGRVVEAKTGQQSGMAAFNYLNTWRTCRFAFVTQRTDTTISNGQSTQPFNQKAIYFEKNGSATYQHSSPPTIPATQYGQSRMPPAGPVRLPAGEVALQRSGQAQIPRLHRHLLLLIDGRRTKSELARLLSRNLEELQVLLNDLERAGLIQQ